MPDAENRRRANFIVDSPQSLDHAHAHMRDILVTADMMETRTEKGKWKAA
jgi:hypothetical protein